MLENSSDYVLQIVERKINIGGRWLVVNSDGLARQSDLETIQKWKEKQEDWWLWKEGKCSCLECLSNRRQEQSDVWC